MIEILFFIWWTVACFSCGGLMMFVNVDKTYLFSQHLKKEEYYANLFLYAPIAAFGWPITFTMVFIEYLTGKRK